MAKRSSQTFAKRQKEMARKEKQAEKAAKRLERKAQKGDGPGGPDIDWSAAVTGPNAEPVPDLPFVDESEERS